MSERSEFNYCRHRFKALCPGLSEPTLDELSLDWRVKIFPARSLLIRPGEMQSEAYLVVHGLVRAYYPEIDGDISVNFIKEGEFATHYTSLERPTPSKFGFQAIEDTTAIACSYAHLQSLCTQSVEVERLLRILVEVEYHRAFAHLETFLLRSAEERYRLFLREFGTILPRISVTDLASYLGISRQALTNIRRKILTD